MLLVCAAGLEIVLTLGAAYGCHFVTEDLLGASGLLAVVVMGFSMSILGKLISTSSYEAVLLCPTCTWCSRPTSLVVPLYGPTSKLPTKLRCWRSVECTQREMQT